MAKVRTARWGHRAEVKKNKSLKAQHPQVRRQLDEAKVQKKEVS